MFVRMRLPIAYIHPPAFTYNSAADNQRSNHFPKTTFEVDTTVTVGFLERMEITEKNLNFM